MRSLLGRRKSTCYIYNIFLYVGESYIVPEISVFCFSFWFTVCLLFLTYKYFWYILVSDSIRFNLFIQVSSPHPYILVCDTFLIFCSRYQNIYLFWYFYFYTFSLHSEVYHKIYNAEPFPALDTTNSCSMATNSATYWYRCFLLALFICI